LQACESKFLDGIFNLQGFKYRITTNNYLEKIRRRENRHNICNRIATVPQKMRSETARTLKKMAEESRNSVKNGWFIPYEKPESRRDN
jgi:DNA-directed RNA polymerase specialized sigma24 family protein